MKFMKVVMSLFSPLLIITVAVFPGCGKNIHLSDDGYNPGASVKNIIGYKDARIYLGSFNNNAAKTKRYAYFSNNKSVSYKTNNLLPDYMWYCFKKAFTEIGMKVNELDEAPVLYLMINDMNDTELKFDINIYKGDDLEHVNQMIVTISDASGTAESDLAMLERNAYNMMDAAIAAVLNDKGFKTSVTKARGTTAIDKKIEGTLVGIVKAVDITASEIIIGSGRIASMVNIGDTVYVVIDGLKISMEVSFPMQTIAKCRIIGKDRKNIKKIKNGDMVYK